MDIKYKPSRQKPMEVMAEIKIITQPILIIEPPTFIGKEDLEEKRKRYIEQYKTGIVILESGDKVAAVLEPHEI